MTVVTPCQHDDDRDGVPQQLGVVMGVDVDEPWAYDTPRRVQFGDLSQAVEGVVGFRTDADDPVPDQGHVGRRRWRTGPVDDRSPRTTKPAACLTSSTPSALGQPDHRPPSAWLGLLS